MFQTEAVTLLGLAAWSTGGQEDGLSGLLAPVGGGEKSGQRSGSQREGCPWG